ncbi:MAG: 50S ribosomal protein L10 [Clostridiales bacterium]|nr:50S ribosomal protein L10 [Clostridiales bacterium]
MKKVIAIKQEQVLKITEKLKNSTSAVFVDYRGLKVEELTELRKIFREAGIEYKVYKNTLVRLAVKNVGMDELVKDLVGPNAVAFSYEDPVVPARIINDFAKKHKNLEFKMGFVEGTYYDQAKLSELAMVPTREVLIAKLLSSLNAPLSNFAYLVKALSEKRESEEQSA